MLDYSALLRLLLADVPRQVQAIHASMTLVWERLRRQQTILRTVAARLVETMQAATQVELEVMRSLRERGWYVTYRFPVLSFIGLHAMVRAGDHEAVEKFMCELAREHLSQVETALCERFPGRTQILQDAFEAHRAGKYTLSIPVFLAQADGIGREVLGIPRQFFRAKSRSVALQRKLSDFILLGKPYQLRGVHGTLLAPLRDESSLGATTEERDERRCTDPWFGPLNRHGVQHGLDLDYPTEGNSLRCITLLEYLLDVDQILHRDIPDELARVNQLWEEAFPEQSPASPVNP